MRYDLMWGKMCDVRDFGGMRFGYGGLVWM